MDFFLTIFHAVFGEFPYKGHGGEFPYKGKGG